MKTKQIYFGQQTIIDMMIVSTPLTMFKIVESLNSFQQMQV